MEQILHKVEQYNVHYLAGQIYAIPGRLAVAELTFFSSPERANVSPFCDCQSVVLAAGHGYHALVVEVHSGLTEARVEYGTVRSVRTVVDRRGGTRRTSGV